MKPSICHFLWLVTDKMHTLQCVGYSTVLLCKTNLSLNGQTAVKYRLTGNIGHHILVDWQFDQILPT
jgi:hypothetical protein